MRYHIDTGLIYQKFNENCSCPLCEIQKIVEEQFLYEFLNDAVMEDNTRIKVGRKGFCEKHFDMMFSRQNKLSVALQMETYLSKLKEKLTLPLNPKKAKAVAKAIEKTLPTCVICELVDESMVKYYKTVARMFLYETDFYKTLLGTKGLCLKHYSKLLQYSSYAGCLSKEYLKTIYGVWQNGYDNSLEKLKNFCNKHDYRNTLDFMGGEENSLEEIRERAYGKKYE